MRCEQFNAICSRIQKMTGGGADGRTRRYNVIDDDCHPSLDAIQPGNLDGDIAIAAAHLPADENIKCRCFRGGLDPLSGFPVRPDEDNVLPGIVGGDRATQKGRGAQLRKRHAEDTVQVVRPMQMRVDGDQPFECI